MRLYGTQSYSSQAGTRIACASSAICCSRMFNNSARMIAATNGESAAANHCVASLPRDFAIEPMTTHRKWPPEAAHALRKKEMKALASDRPNHALIVDPGQR